MPSRNQVSRRYSILWSRDLQETVKWKVKHKRLHPPSNQNQRLSRTPLRPSQQGWLPKAGEQLTKEQLKTLLEQTKRNATRGAAQQIGALTQQVHNLRERLNMALTQIEKFEKHNRSGVGA